MHSKRLKTPLSCQHSKFPVPISVMYLVRFFQHKIEGFRFYFSLMKWHKMTYEIWNFLLGVQEVFVFDLVSPKPHSFVLRSVWKLKANTLRCRRHTRLVLNKCKHVHIDPLNIFSCWSKSACKERDFHKLFARLNVVILKLYSRSVVLTLHAKSLYICTHVNTHLHIYIFVHVHVHVPINTPV